MVRKKNSKVRKRSETKNPITKKKYQKPKFKESAKVPRRDYEIVLSKNARKRIKFLKSMAYDKEQYERMLKTAIKNEENYYIKHLFEQELKKIEVKPKKKRKLTEEERRLAKHIKITRNGAERRERTYQSYASTLNQIEKRLGFNIKSFLDNSPKAIVVEIGTGKGIAAIQLDRWHKGKLEIYAQSLVKDPHWKKNKNIHWSVSRFEKFVENLITKLKGRKIKLMFSSLGTHYVVPRAPEYYTDRRQLEVINYDIRKFPIIVHAFKQLTANLEKGGKMVFDIPMEYANSLIEALKDPSLKIKKGPSEKNNYSQILEITKLKELD